MDNVAFQSDEDRTYQTFPLGTASIDELRKRRVEKRAVPENDEKVELRKDIGFISCIGILVGTIIGSGIFISPKGVLQGCGSVGLTLIVWILCGFFSFIGALSFAELGTLMPFSGGIYMYSLEGFAPQRKEKKLFWGPLVGFLYSWQTSFFARPASFAVQGMSVASYIMKLNPLACTDPSSESYQFKLRIIAIVVMTTITTVNCLSVNVSTTFINFFMVTKLLALSCIIIGGFVGLAQGTSEALSTGFEGTEISISGITTAIYSGLWAYAGWDNLNFVAKEIKHPEKNIVRAVIISILLVTAVYFLTNISYFVILTKTEFVESDAVAVDFVSKLVGYFGGVLMILSVVFSIIGSTTGGSFVGNRILYAAAREGHLMDFLSFLNIKYLTPMVAFIFSLVLSIFMIWSSDILGLIFLAGLLDSIFLATTMICFLVMRKTKKDDHRPIKVPLVAPLMTLLFATFLFIAPFLGQPKVEYFYVLIFLAVGVIFYTVFVYYEFRISAMDTVRKYIQIIFNAVPPEGVEI